MNIKLKLSPDFYKEEAKELVVSPKTKRLWATLLDLYAEFKRVCDENGLKFYADSGTMIGALRHQGFIPWDDDIDLLMFRKDYEKLCQLAPSVFEYPYFWQTNYSDPGSCRGHAQLRNSATTGILKGEMANGKPCFRFNQGIFIDIFPLDNVPDDLTERKVFCDRLQRLRNKVMDIRWVSMEVPFSFKSLLRPSAYKRRIRYWYYKFLKSCLGYDALSRAYQKLDECAQVYNEKKTLDCAPISFRPVRKSKEYYPVIGFANQKMVKFEMLEMPVPENADEMLTAQYGNWHEHVVGGSSHGGMLIDVDRPYTEYLK